MNNSISNHSYLITGGSLFTIPFAHSICDDIDQSLFADRVGTTINHPAFVLAHTAYYAGVCVQLLGGSINFDEDEAVLYEFGSECLDDPSKYLSKDACFERYESRFKNAAEFLSSCNPAILEASADHTPFVGRFGTLGEVASFMLLGHPCFHLGQLSAWRRVAGLGPTS